MSNDKFLHQETLKSDDDQNISFWLIFLYFVLGIGVLIFIFYILQKLTNYLQRKKFLGPNQPIVMLVGSAGVGKTQIAQSMAKNSNKELIQSVDVKDFFHIHGSGLTIADTPSFELSGSTETRDKTIENFQKYFYLCLKRVCALAIVVNFERTDLMKKKIGEVYSYISKFNCDIIIIVTDWQLSENAVQDQQDLEKRFSHYNPKSIIFVKRNENHSNLWLKLSELNLDLPSQINLEGTMFEQPNLVEQQQFTNQLQKSLEKSQAEKKSNNYTDETQDKLLW